MSHAKRISIHPSAPAPSMAPTTRETTLAMVAPHGFKHFHHSSLLIVETEHPCLRTDVTMELSRRVRALLAALEDPTIAHVRVREAVAHRQGAGWHMVTADGHEADYDSPKSAATALLWHT